MNKTKLIRALALAVAMSAAGTASAWWNGPWGGSPWNSAPWGGGPWNSAPWSGSPWGGYPGWGRTYTGIGPMDALMNGDVDFNIRFRGAGNMFGRGYGYGRPYYGYGYPAWGYPRVAMAPRPAPTAAAAKPEPKVEQPKDGDEDGVLDTTDLCPNSPADAKVDFTGCSAAQPITLQGVNFKLDSDELTPESSVILDRVVRTLTANPEVRVEIGGHTDSQGAADYNLDLSDRRANTVRGYLIASGVRSDNLTARGYGQTKPVDTNETPAGRARNRRVELTRLDGDAAAVVR